jgi:hypothetical protein
VAALPSGQALPQLGRADDVLVVSYLRETDGAINGGFFEFAVQRGGFPLSRMCRISGRRWFTILQALHLSRLEQELTARGHCKTLLLDHR